MAVSSIEEFSRAPSAALRDLVTRYFERRVHFDQEVILTFPIRPDLFIDFHLTDYLRIRSSDGDPRAINSDVIVVAPHAGRLVTGHLTGTVHHFCIQLQPTALHRLLGIGMQQLTDLYVPAADLFGPSLHRLRDAVLSARGFDARVAASERWLADMRHGARNLDGVDIAAHAVRHTGGLAALDLLASRAGLSERQWRRRFTEQTGLPPKLYARITRLDTVLERRRAEPDMSWAEIAQRSGYSDQSHMLRDARDLLGTTPARWLAEPELGSHTLAHHLAVGAETSR
jgi:AraC-like DNA-binding protein